MGRVGIKINEVDLRRELTVAESARTFKNETELFTYVANTTWGKSGCKDDLGRTRELTAALIYNRVKQFNIQLTTVKGKRGNPNIGVRLTPDEKAEKISKRPNFLTSVANLRIDALNHYRAKEGDKFKALPPHIEKLLQRRAKGNLKATVNLNCRECCCWEASEAARCQVVGCAMYLINPFLKAGVNPEQAEEVESTDEGESNE